MFIPKEILQAIVFATIIGIFIVIGFAIYSPKTSFDACVDAYIEWRINQRKEIYEGRDEKVPKLGKDDLALYRDLGFHRCRGKK